MAYKPKIMKDTKVEYDGKEYDMTDNGCCCGTHSEGHECCGHCHHEEEE